ncbi:MAG: ATP-binding protein, partial [Clostridium sp.]|nr:ATP-binding protein [Clostridium sp.]
HSRIYIDIQKTDTEQVVFTMKNISATPLNIHPDELTERFVRGDVARTTEGSGLGLSIAKSLTELLGGQFELFIDGDLFKAQLIFSLKAKEKDTENN